MAINLAFKREKYRVQFLYCKNFTAYSFRFQKLNMVYVSIRLHYILDKSFKTFRTSSKWHIRNRGSQFLPDNSFMLFFIAENSIFSSSAKALVGLCGTLTTKLTLFNNNSLRSTFIFQVVVYQTESLEQRNDMLVLKFQGRIWEYYEYA